MITLKFGGTAMTPQNIKFVKQAVQNQNCAVVVSAPGKTFSADKKVTDLLIAYYRDKSDENWQPIVQKFRALAYFADCTQDIDRLLFEARQNARSSLWHCMSVGEELSAKITANYLGLDYVEADKTFVFDICGKLLKAQTIANLKAAFRGVNRAVIGGFYGGSTNGRKVFSRGGSDVSGAYVAVATNSVLYQNCTDVCGVYVADPALVVDSRRHEFLSYAQMELLSRHGASVLHRDAVSPLKKRSIPLEIKCFYAPRAVGTMVENVSAQNTVLTVTERKTSRGYCCEVLHCLDAVRAAQLTSRLIERTQKITFGIGCAPLCLSTNVYGVLSTQSTVKFYAESSVLQQVYNVFVR